MGTQGWVCSRVKEWLRLDPDIGAKELQKRLVERYNIHIPYGRVFHGRMSALDQLFGKWDDTYNMLHGFKNEVVKRMPGSVVEVCTEQIEDKVCFKRAFVALKPCIDGFLSGCRPYLAIDSTHLTGRYRGQLAAAVGIDGHNWMYPVAYGIIESESIASWEWFLQKLHTAIGAPQGLVISTDAGKDIDAAVGKIYPDAEHRECMRHLMKNFSKKFRGGIFASNMWPAARTFLQERFEIHMRNIENKCPAAIAYLTEHHHNKWSRSMFETTCKVDYINTNVAETFNNWIKDHKSLPLVDLLDKIRQLLMVKFDKRRRIGSKLEGAILPSLLKEINIGSRGAGQCTILRSGDETAEVTMKDSSGKDCRHVVEMDKMQCSCRQWQVCGKPCPHATAFICSIRGAKLQDYVHEYFSVDRFRQAYAQCIMPLPDKEVWSGTMDIHPPMQRRPPGRPRKQRIKGSEEIGRRRQKCKRCNQLGHQSRTCKEPVGEIETPSIGGRRVSIAATESMVGSNTPGVSISVSQPLKKRGRPKKSAHISAGTSGTAAADASSAAASKLPATSKSTRTGGKRV